MTLSPCRLSAEPTPRNELTGATATREIDWLELLPPGETMTVEQMIGEIDHSGGRAEPVDDHARAVPAMNGVAGTLTGSRLDTYPVSTVSWAQFRDANPDGLVLSRDTGFDRNYGRNPYPGYDDVNTAPFLFRGETDGRLPAKTRIVGIEIDGDAVAVKLDDLARRGVVKVTVAGRPIVVFHRPGTASALDASTVDDGVDVGTTGVFTARVDGRDTTFKARDGLFVDAQTSTRWDVLGHATTGPGSSARAVLEPVVHVDTFWFAWAAFRPQSRIVG